MQLLTIHMLHMLLIGRHIYLHILTMLLPIYMLIIVYLMRPMDYKYLKGMTNKYHFH